MESQAALHEFLRQKGIDATALAQALPDRYAHFAHVMGAAGASGLDYAHKFLWNELRLEFPAKEDSLKKD
jgi:hypothetical protein